MDNTEFCCPQCGKSDGIDISIQTWARMTFDASDGQWNGTDADESDSHDHEWDSESTARCAHCLYTAKSGEFENEDWNPNGDEPDEQEQPEPGDDDITTSNGTHFYQYGKPVLVIGNDCTLAERNAAIKAYMDREQFWPNVFEISDHGNEILLKYWETEQEQPARVQPDGNE